MSVAQAKAFSGLPKLDAALSARPPPPDPYAPPLVHTRTLCACARTHNTVHSISVLASTVRAGCVCRVCAGCVCTGSAHSGGRRYGVVDVPWTELLDGEVTAAHSLHLTVTRAPICTRGRARARAHVHAHR